jgi:hypothetical protein
VCVDLALGREAYPGGCHRWTEAHLSVAISHNLGPWFYKSLGSREFLGLSPELIQILRGKYLAASLAWLSRERLLRELLAAFNGAHISVALLKGSHLAAVVYESPCLRTMSDVDLLVPGSQFETAADVLCALGYKPQFEALDSVQTQSIPALTFVRPDKAQATVDLHRELRFMDYYRFPSELVWSQASETMLDGQRFFFLSPELNFIHVAMHSFTHTNSMRDWLDMHLLLTRTAFDWEQFLSLTSSLGVMRPLTLVLGHLSRTWGTRIPESVEKAVYRYKPRWFEDYIIRGKFRYFWRFVARFSRFKGLRAKLGYLCQALFPSREYRAAVVGSSHWRVYLMSKIFYFISHWKRR